MPDEDRYSLATITDNPSSIDIFSGGSADKVVEAIESEVRGVVHDVDTAKGRKEIASLAHKVSRSKQALDSLGKDLVAEWKTKSKAVDAERKIVRDRLDALRDEVRKPLTEWEEAEKARAAQKALEAEIEDAHEQALQVHDLWLREQEIKRKEEQAAKEAEDKRLKEEAETARIAQIKRDEDIARQAAEKARIDAEQKAANDKAEAERKIAEAKAAEERAKREQAEAAAAAEEKRQQDIKAAEDKIRREHEEAEEQRRREEAAKIKREADRKAEEDRIAANRHHRGKINRTIIDSMVDKVGISEDQAKKIVTLAAKGSIPGLSVKY